MNRCRDYINFAVKFVGLGYVALWPLSVTNTTGTVFGAGFVCGGRLGAAVDHLCHLPHPLRMGFGLHVVGAAFAAAALLHLAVCAVRPQAAASGDTPAPTATRKAPRFRLRPLPRPRKPGRPRKEFGLRGVPR